MTSLVGSVQREPHVVGTYVGEDDLRKSMRLGCESVAERLVTSNEVLGDGERDQDSYP